MAEEKWVDVGSAEELASNTITPVLAGTTPIALVHRDGAFAAISGVCNHVGGPLGEGRLDGDYVVCPWHHWKFHCRTGEGEPGFEEDRVPALRRRSWRTAASSSNLRTSARRATSSPHAPHPLARPVRREAGPVRVAGISTTVMDRANPRYSTSEALLGARARARRSRRSAPRRASSASASSASAPARATTRRAPTPAPGRARSPRWTRRTSSTRSTRRSSTGPTSILVATPIRWGAASSLYYKMVERMNCVQNQVTTRNRVLIRNKVAGFIITGGQDNVQAVAGQMLGFFAELGFLFPQFPYIAHSRGWSAEDMERNVEELRTSQELRDGHGRAGGALHDARPAPDGRRGPHARARRPRRPQGPLARGAVNMATASAVRKTILALLRRKATRLDLRPFATTRRLPDQYTSTPNAQQMSAFAVAIVKSSVPRGEKSSKNVFESETATASAIHTGGRPLAKTSPTQIASDARKHAQVPATDFLFTSPMPQTLSFCFPKSEPTISDAPSLPTYDSHTIANRTP